MKNHSECLATALILDALYDKEQFLIIGCNTCICFYILFSKSISKHAMGIIVIWYPVAVSRLYEAWRVLTKAFIFLFLPLFSVFSTLALAFEP